MVSVGNDRYAVWPSDDTIAVRMRDGRPISLSTSDRVYTYVGLEVTDVDAAEYAGVYWSDDLGTEWRVEADTGNAGGIALFHRTQDTDRFRPAFRDGFWSGGDWLTFVRDRRGRVTGFTWSNGRVRKVVFSRR